MRRALAVAGVVLLSACSAHQIDLEALSSASDQIVWEAAQKAVEKKDWESTHRHGSMLAPRV